MPEFTEFIFKLEETSKTEGKVEVFKVPSILSGILDGKYGNGAERKKKVEAEGYDYKTVQKMINEMVGG